MCGYYPKSKVEIKGFMAAHYDTILDIVTFGRYSPLIKKAIEMMRIRPQDRILDLGTGTGRNACLMMKYFSKDGKLIREKVIKNVFEVLKNGGVFFILDYNEFDKDLMPFYLRILFKLMECPYAFDFIEKDWKKILAKSGYKDFEEHIFFDYIRLLKAKKITTIWVDYNSPALLYTKLWKVLKNIEPRFGVRKTIEV